MIKQFSFHGNHTQLTQLTLLTLLTQLTHLTLLTQLTQLTLLTQLTQLPFYNIGKVLVFIGQRSTLACTLYTYRYNI